MPETPLYVRVATYAKLYETHPKTIRKWIEAGLLDTIRVGRRYIRVRNVPPADRRQSPPSR